MFNLLASKIGDAQAFADGLVNLDVINMDRLLEEQEREERSKDESLRLLRTSGDITDAASSQDSSRDSSGTGTTAATVGMVERDDNKRLDRAAALREIDSLQVRTHTEQREQLKQHSRLSPSRGAREDSFGDRFASMEEDGGNFEDEFDPILASIRKPRQQQQPASTTARADAGILSPRGPAATAIPSGGDWKRGESDEGRPTARSSFATAFLSMLPGEMRAKAGEVMAQSSLRISESTNAFRSALDPGSTAPSATKNFKRRQSDLTYSSMDDGDVELGEGAGGKGGGGRTGRGEGDEDEVRLMNLTEVLSEEERQQLASFSGGGGGAGRFCGWRRLRKYIPIFAGIGLLGLFYLWRWMTLLVGNNTANGIQSLGSERM